MNIPYTTTVGEIAHRCGGVLRCGNPAQAVRSISTDSRQLGDDCFFIPLRGERFDGHDFLTDLIQRKKIVGFITERDDIAQYASSHNVAAVLCDNSLFAYGKLASAHRMNMPARIIGITGTNGKTTTKELLWTILSAKYKCHKNEKNFNNEVGVPYSLLQLQRDDVYSVIEMGMNHAGEIERLSKIAKPNIAVITSIGEGHLEFLGSVENVAKAKAEIVWGMEPNSTLYVNGDSPHIEIVREVALRNSVRIQTFSLRGNADIFPERFSLDKKNIEISVFGETYCAPLYGIHNAYNLLIAIAVGLHCGVTNEEIKSSLLKFRAVDKRSELIEREFIIINDTYNSNPLSAESALISAQMIFPTERKIAVLSDMKELGKESARYHRAIGKKVFECGFEALFTWGDFSNDLAEGAREGGMSAECIHRFLDKQELIRALLRVVKSGDVILIKGSRAMKMEEVVEALLR
ncbi:MAG: UDP-N-acetylmuramoyl-tripeptide--D-alanyl-D-alanine ligase [Spirochaetes bacterium]|nr:UDP-N-acetylmuramoyl-tripeptide--D-alanyl-D-alanine ligase [Spirochaetota bacterium]